MTARFGGPQLPPLALLQVPPAARTWRRQMRGRRDCRAIVRYSPEAAAAHPKNAGADNGRVLSTTALKRYETDLTAYRHCTPQWLLLALRHTLEPKRSANPQNWG